MTRPAADPAVAAGVLADRLGAAPDLLLVLGSGLGGVADALADPTAVPFADLPGFPPVTVEGHDGRWVVGTLGGRRVAVQMGRYHLYEGHSASVVALPVRAAAAWGVETLVVTNAAGGIRRDLDAGSLVVLVDHLNLQGDNPLIGRVVGDEQRFPDMTHAYDPALIERADTAARELGVTLARGVYAGVRGPSYETPAEIRMLEHLGADVVGMSTVCEVVVARALGLRCLGFSLVTNAAAGRTPTVLDHADVVEVARRGGATLGRLLHQLVPALSRSPHASP